MDDYVLVRSLDGLANCEGCAFYGDGEQTCESAQIQAPDGCSKGDAGYIWKKLKTDEQPANESVNHPLHYNWLPSNVEAEDICEHFPWRIGAAIKYLYRHQHKHDDRGVEDLRKAVNQIQKHIKLLEGDYVQYERKNERMGDNPPPPPPNRTIKSLGL